MNPWITTPTWQNYSSMYREAATAQEVKTGVERSHHLTAALYFGVAALESFINERTRLYLSGSKSESEILDILRHGTLRGVKKKSGLIVEFKAWWPSIALGKQQAVKDGLIDKLKKWPKVMLGKKLDLRRETVNNIVLFNDVRGDLTHPKSHGHDIYRKLDELDPDVIVDTVAEYIAQFYKAHGSRFPYWLWGWNYLNPSQQLHEIMLLNPQQFVFSMMRLGESVRADLPDESESWQDKYMRDYDGYRALAGVLKKLDQCEPKSGRFPYEPKLCRRWWATEHHKSCGFVSAHAIGPAGTD